MNLIEEIKNSEGEIAILLDPEKIQKNNRLKLLIEKISQSYIRYIFIGGSTEKKMNLDKLILFIKEHTQLPIIIFPGHHTQVSKYADGIFYLSLLTSKNPKYLIEEQLKSTPFIFKSNIEIIPTGYFLLDEKGSSSTSKMTKEAPNKFTKKELLNLSLTAKYLGKNLLLFDYGSGVKNSFQKTYIKEIKSKTKLPIIVGGGINSTKEIIKLKKLGSNIIIVGNHIENNPEFLEEIKSLNFTKS